MQNNNIHIIGIAGGSASGKTSFLYQLKNSFSDHQICVISQDDYYKPVEHQIKDENGYINYDLPQGIDHLQFIKDIQNLKEGNPVTIQEYVFNNPGVVPGSKVLKPAPIIIVEGLFIFWFDVINELLDLRIFIDAKEEVRLDRRLNRDKAERNVDHDHIMYQWMNHVTPSYKQYLLPFKEEVDLIINNNKNFNLSLELLTNHIHHKLNNNK